MSAPRLVVIALRLLLGGLFIYASLSKIVDPAGFSRTVYHYKLLPGSAVNALAIVLPWVEFLVGLLIVIGFKMRGALLVAIASLVVFLAAMGSALARGLNIDCGCFAASGTPLGLDRIIGDLVLIAAAIFVYRASSTTRVGRLTSAGIARPGLKEIS